MRQQAITVIHDADECRDETVLQLHGGHVVRVPVLAGRSAGVVRVETAWEPAVVPFYAAWVSDIGPGGFVQIECACAGTQSV